MPPAHATLRTLLAGILLALPSGAAAGALSGPILFEGARAEIVDVVQLPATQAGQPRARLNVLREAPDGSGRLFVNDLRGPLHVVDGGVPSLYLDLAAEFPAFRDAPGLATGFVSFAFHPDFASNGLFYTVHTETPGATPPNLLPALPITTTQHCVLTEFQAADPGADSFAGTRRELMRIAAPHHFHNLGEIGFDPNLPPGHPDYGLLYIGAGDFGSVQTGQSEQLQRLDTPYGALLRIDPLGAPFLRGGILYDYGIPAGNPWAADGDPDTWGEILLHGLRNGHRLVWDTAGEGTLFVTDIGQGNLEEVDVAAAGANYGWPVREGSYALDPDVDPESVFALPPGDASLGFTYPAAQYDHEEGLAIAGGAVVRGGGIPELEGRLLFGDIVNGRLFYADVDALLAADDGDPATTAPVHELALRRNGAFTTLLQVIRDELGSSNVNRTDLRLHRGLSGEIYLTTKRDGFVRRLVASPRQVPALPPGPAGPALLTLALLGGAALSRRARTRGRPR